MSTVMLAISEKMAQWLSTTPSWLQNAPEGIQNIFYQLYQTWIMNDNWHYFTDGLKVTILATLGALVIGVVIGVLIAVIRSAHDSSRKKPPVALRILNALSKLYLTVVRGTPMIVQLLIMCFVVMVPRGQEELLRCATITFGLNSGAYVAEIIRSGIQSIDQGQMEAGRSLGFNYGQTMRYIIIPQAIKTILPALGNELITLLKETSVATVIGLNDLTKGAQIIVSTNYTTLVSYISLAAIYLVLVLALTKLLSIFERRMKNSDR